MRCDHVRTTLCPSWQALEDSLEKDWTHNSWLILDAMGSFRHVYACSSHLELALAITPVTLRIFVTYAVACHGRIPNIPDKPSKKQRDREARQQRRNLAAQPPSVHLPY